MGTGGHAAGHLFITTKSHAGYLSFCVHLPDEEILGKWACGSPEFEL